LPFPGPGNLADLGIDQLGKIAFAVEQGNSDYRDAQVGKTF